MPPVGSWPWTLDQKLGTALFPCLNLVFAELVCIVLLTTHLLFLGASRGASHKGSAT